MLFFTSHSSFTLGTVVLFRISANHGLNSRSQTPLGKLFKWPWLYPPCITHSTSAAQLSSKKVRLWGVHWHRTGWPLIDCTFRFNLQTLCVLSLTSCLWHDISANLFFNAACHPQNYIYALPTGVPYCPSCLTFCILVCLVGARSKNGT